MVTIALATARIESGVLLVLASDAVTFRAIASAALGVDEALTTVVISESRFTRLASPVLDRLARVLVMALAILSAAVSETPLELLMADARK